MRVQLILIFLVLLLGGVVALGNLGVNRDFDSIAFEEKMLDTGC